MTPEESQFWNELTERLESKLEKISHELHSTAEILEELIHPTLKGLIALLQDRQPAP